MYDVTPSELAVVLFVTAAVAIALGWSLGATHGRPTPTADPGVKPLAAALAAVETQLRSTERDRAAGQAALTTEVALMRASSESLRRETASLSTALRAPQVRGRWGETQLRRVLELGGALEHCDFTEQTVLADGRRPDVVVRLAGDRRIVIDAKVPLEAFLAATEATEDAERLQCRRDHARQLRAHIQKLSAKSYWSGLPGSPEFVVLFLPGEAFLDAALAADPTLQEVAFAANVVLATPATLLALIRTIAYTWRQDRLADGAREIAVLGRELHDRLATMSGHLGKLGASLRGSVDAYNSTLASLESRVFPSARRLSAFVSDHPEKGPGSAAAQSPEAQSTSSPYVGSTHLPGSPTPVDAQPRPMTAPELLLLSRTREQSRVR